MANEDEFEVSKKLAAISLTMADAFYFMKLRTIVEEWDRMAKAGDKTAQAAMQMIDQFHGLCTHVTKK